MKLRTSYFNAGVLKKDLTRFAPLWGLYTVFMLLFLLLIRESNDTAYTFAMSADSIMQGMGVVNFFYAGLTALLLFSDLYKSRQAYALHAMPLRREGWFFTHSLAGLLMCLIPNLLGAVISAAMLGQYAYLAYLWLAVMLLEYLCFFGIGVFSVLCAGNALGAMAAYGLLNYLAVLVAALCKCFYEPVLFGVTVDTGFLAVFCPVVQLVGDSFVTLWSVAGGAVFKGFVTGQWLYAGLAAFAGLVFWGLGLLIYRKRKLETAGDLIAFRPARPVFLVLYTLCVGAVFYLMGTIFNSNTETVLLLIGLALGWFTGKMLLEKRVHVFRVKTFLGLAALVFCFYLSVTVVWLDPVGITRYVPDPEKVESVRIAPYTSDYYYGTHSANIYDKATIEKLTQLHKKLVQERVENEHWMVLRLRYTMKTGIETERQYYVDINSADGQWLKTVYSSPEAVLGSGDMAAMKRTLRFAEVYGYQDALSNPENPKDFWKIDQDDYDGLLEALWADCQTGNMVQMWEYHQNESHVATLNLQIGSSSYRDVLVYESCTHTVEFLKQLAAKQTVTE